MTDVVRKLFAAAKVLVSDPLIVNAYVRMADGRPVAWNWGDDINYHFLKHLTKREIAVYFETPITMKLKKINYLCIGSTLNYLSTPETVVWGAGVIDDQLDLRAVPARITAVRGPLSRAYLRDRGIDCPEVYGDPALLIPYFYRPAPAPSPHERRIGIVPHYEDKDAPAIEAIRRRHPEVRVFDIADYGSWTDFIDGVAGCDVLFSSSLHGLIMAEAYAVPNYWVEFSDKVIGKGFKFRDYYASLGKPTPEPLRLDAGSDLDEIIEAHSWSAGTIDLRRLLDACPFEIKQAVRYEHPLDL
ncbi:polysaccharide pyruvyl transferase family protein [Acuticoccus kandeliae]|uniref:polysaccharide pyruvyl transferase family protein n=1 Tax=Acuticoccus kandeliae TaxID=2073160 RepID=UPI000D3ED373|nr:polysaccharide pyruvyl transferase family protein [Acuticoccus kandeliae]